ncbi:MAG: TetR family transcriptional regulator [Lentimicrobiaceae bacterium]|nr:TetR family transcriptional regulator [Lentimicrobiaceae bacterium]
METSTRDKIIIAAKELFTERGYNATKSRDIANLAGINLALLNYHFKSKENLYKIIVYDSFVQILGNLEPILSDEKISLIEKIEILAKQYTALLIENENLPFFVLRELQKNADIFKDIMQSMRLKTENVFTKQLLELGSEQTAIDIIFNTISLVIMPFITKQLFISSGLISEDEFVPYMKQRQEKIPYWIMQMVAND